MTKDAYKSYLILKHGTLENMFNSWLDDNLEINDLEKEILGEYAVAALPGMIAEVSEIIERETLKLDDSEIGVKFKSITEKLDQSINDLVSEINKTP